MATFYKNRRKIEELQERLKYFEEKEEEKVQERLKREQQCCKPRCKCCKAMLRSDEVQSYQTGEKCKLKKFKCNDEMTIYMIECACCPSFRYVGSAKESMRIRSQGHRREARQKIGALSHFNSGGCTLEDYRVIILDQLRHNQTKNEMKKLLKLKGIWMQKIPENINRRLEGNGRKKKSKKKSAQ